MVLEITADGSENYLVTLLLKLNGHRHKKEAGPLVQLHHCLLLFRPWDGPGHYSGVHTYHSTWSCSGFEAAVSSCRIMSSPNNSIHHSSVPLCPFLRTLLAAFITLFYGYWNFLLLTAFYAPNVLYSRQFILKILKILLGDGHLTWNRVSHRWFILGFIGSL